MYRSNDDKIREYRAHPINSDPINSNITTWNRHVSTRSIDGKRTLFSREMNFFLYYLRATSLIIRDHANSLFLSRCRARFYLQRMKTPSREARHAQHALHGSHVRFRSIHIAMVPRPPLEKRTNEIYRKDYR